MAQKSKCLDDNTLFRYIDKQLRGEHLKRIERHLDECTSCRKELAQVLKLMNSPQSEDEKKILATMQPFPVEKRLFDLFGETAAEEQKGNTVQNAAKTQVSTFNKERLFDFFHRPSSRRPQVVFVIILLLSLAGFGFRYYQTDFQINKAEKIVERHFKTPRNELRLSGDYSASGLGKYMGSEQTPEYIQQAQQRLKHARKFGAHSSEMRTLWSHIYIIEQDYSKADSILLAHDTANSVSALNDLGVSAFKQNHIDQALDYFMRALSIEPNHAPTLYNIGSLYLNNDDEKALPYFEKCLDYETDPEWRKIIQEKITDIKG